MPKLKDMTMDELNTSLQGFNYSNVSMEKLGASEYTIVQIVVDKTGSVGPFKKDLEDMLTMSIESCKKSPRSLNLLARTTLFNTPFSGMPDIEELHGFTLLNTIDTSKFAGTINPMGSTPLYDATLEAIDTLYDYGKKLYEKQIVSNAIVFIITDGDENASAKAKSPKIIKETIENIRREEVLESIRVILIGINDTDPSVKQKLDEFRKDAGIDEYVSVGEATKGKLAKVAQFVSQSTSSQSQSLGSGAGSQPINYSF